MKRIVYLLITCCVAQQLSAQVPEDALRMSFNPIGGTARVQAIGGAFGSMGGDITSTFINPAGLGFYKTGEFVLSPGISFLNGKSNYGGSRSVAESYNKFQLSASGIVWGQASPYGRWRNRAVSLAVNRIANFNGRVFYQGENNYSSFSESFAEEFARSGADISANPYTVPVSYGAKLASWTYLIDTLSTNAGTEVIGLPQRGAIVHGVPMDLFQTKDVQTRGGITEIAFGYAANMDDKVYLGGSVGIPIVNYDRTSTFTEEDLSGSDSNDFNYSTYREQYTSQGVGINARFGVIFKPAEQVRAGIAIHTPTLYGLREQTTGRMETDLDEYRTNQVLGVANEDTIFGQFGADVPEYRYDLVSPWKFLVSGSYILNGQVADVAQQRGFITADIEYVTHRSSRFSSADAADDQDYYAGVNDAVRFSYKGAVNFRVGGELKFNTLMTRLGFAYYGNPYSAPDLRARKMNLSGGFGYRDKGIFADITYVYGFNRDVDFPYRLADKDNVLADITNHNSSLLLTLGFKF